MECDDSKINLSDYFEAVQTSNDPKQLLFNELASVLTAEEATVITEAFPSKLSDLKLEGARDRIAEVIGKMTSEMVRALDKLILQFHDLLQDVIHRIKFLPDKTLQAIIEFLSIRSPDRSLTMFDSLPFMVQGCLPGTKLTAIVAPTLQPYVHFINKQSDDDLLKLAKGSCLLGIKPLITLTGCKLASMINSMTETQVRRRFGIPGEFRDAVIERVQQVPKQADWMAMI